MWCAGRQSGAGGVRRYQRCCHNEPIPSPCRAAGPARKGPPRQHGVRNRGQGRALRSLGDSAGLAEGCLYCAQRPAGPGRSSQITISARPLTGEARDRRCGHGEAPSRIPGRQPTAPSYGPRPGSVPCPGKCLLPARLPATAAARQEHQDRTVPRWSARLHRATAEWVMACQGLRWMKTRPKTAIWICRNPEAADALDSHWHLALRRRTPRRRRPARSQMYSRRRIQVRVSQPQTGGR